jgi:hypothetical protein
MSDPLANKSREDLLLVGKAICRDRDWRWVAIWAYNVHRLFRGAMQHRKIWDDLDSLLCRECDWHLGRDLFQAIRQVSLNVEKEQPDKAEYAYLQLGEVTAKCISNASWSPGLFDLNAPWQVPALAFEICRQLHDDRQADFLHRHFTSLSENRYADKPTRG